MLSFFVLVIFLFLCWCIEFFLLFFVDYVFFLVLGMFVKLWPSVSL